MNKNVKKVFLLIATLVVIFLGWQMVFKDGGIIQTGYNAVVGIVNDKWEQVSGNSELIPEWSGKADNATDVESGMD